MFKIFFTLFISFILISCQKSIESPDLVKLTNLSNYSLKQTKVNDSITKISGDNSDYFIEGNFNKKQNKKKGWWKIQSKKQDENIEIEYVILNNEKVNQVKYYLDGRFMMSLSQYYVIENTKDKFRVKFNFPEYAKNINKNESSKEKYEVTYRILDTITNKIIRQSSTDLKKSKNYYYFETLKNKNENGIVGFADKLLFEKVNDSAKLSAETLHFRD